MSAGEILKSFCPPVLLPLVRRLGGGGIGFSGPYQSWADAVTRSSGYESAEIKDRVVEATRRVLAGDAAFERDSVTFSRMEYPFHLIAPLLRAAVMSGGVLRVLDYGGSLGSTYRQCKAFLDGISLTWYVVEQPAFVEAGEREFATSELRFLRSVEQMPTEGPPAVALFSSVLQYLESPYAVLQQGAVRRCSLLVIDRTPFHGGQDDLPCVQVVPKRIYPASYPAWVFGYENFVKVLSRDWRMLAELESAEGVLRSPAGTITFRGLIMERNRAA